MWQPALESHVHQYFSGHQVSSLWWQLGRIRHENPNLTILKVAPGPRIGVWSFVTIGASTIDPSSTPGIEYVVSSPEDTPRLARLLTMVASYSIRHALGVGHIVPIGEPWLPGSTCEHLLVSLPYPFGPELENCCTVNPPVRFLWLLPITEPERQFALQHGVEALEQRFDKVELQFWQAGRESAV